MLFQNLGRLIIKPHILMFLVIFFVCGAVWGFLEGYLFWFLEDLGSTKVGRDLQKGQDGMQWFVMGLQLTMGVSLAIGTVAGIPLTIASSAIIAKFG